MPLIIDSHAHIFPNPLQQFTPENVRVPIEAIRRRARSWLKPVVGSLHKAQVFLRHIPEPARFALDEISGLAPLPSLLFESTSSDLIASMDEDSINFALVLAHPPMISNESIMQECKNEPRLLSVVNIPAGTARPGVVLKNFIKQGAKALKIHPAADSDGPKSPRYRLLLKAAEDLGIPVIIHTGCLNSHLFYRNPQLGQAQRYENWFETYPHLRFILAHMNFHEPLIALDLMEKHNNLFADTSWQPAEIIGEAVRRVGAERILFGTDWPFIGNNLDIGLARVRDCIESGVVTEAQSELILGQNALKLFAIQPQKVSHGP
ncbi:amidohydrolase family protein [Bdellovibrionota bacterium FG-1]